MFEVIQVGRVSESSSRLTTGVTSQTQHAYVLPTFLADFPHKWLSYLSLPLYSLFLQQLYFVKMQNDSPF